MLKEKSKILRWLVKKYQPEKILEIGTSAGYSSIIMAQYAPKDGKITSIEINADTAQTARQNIKKAGLEKIIEVITGDAMKIIPKLGDNFDLLFLNAKKEEYYSYLMLAENKLAKRAVVTADNVKTFEYEMRDYLDYVRTSKNYESECYDFGYDAMEISFKKK